MYFVEGTTGGNGEVDFSLPKPGNLQNWKEGREGGRERFSKRYNRVNYRYIHNKKRSITKLFPRGHCWKWNITATVRKACIS